MDIDVREIAKRRMKHARIKLESPRLTEDDREKYLRVIDQMSKWLMNIALIELKKQCAK